MKFSIRLLYLYLFSFIGLIVAVIGTIQLVDLGIKTYIFKGADKYEVYPQTKQIDPSTKEILVSEEDIKLQKEYQERENTRNRQRQVSTAVAMILVGVPLYLYHWNTIKKENKKS